MHRTQPPLNGRIKASSNKEFRLQVHFCINISYLLPEVCFQLLSVTSKMIPFQPVHFEPMHMQNSTETI